MSEPRNPRQWATLGWVALAVGLAAGTAMFLQPWRTCVEDDAPAGCPATELDAHLLLGALLLCVAGLALVMYAAVRRRLAGPGGG